MPVLSMPLTKMSQLVVIILIAFLMDRSAAPVTAQSRGRSAATTAAADTPSSDVNQAYIREHYTKYEYTIPMRDGVKLLTAVYVPKDDAQPYPIVLTRTPYGVGPYG